eukprot:3788200-Pleurochrysis_carterae.AAC.1
MHARSHARKHGRTHARTRTQRPHDKSAYAGARMLTRTLTRTPAHSSAAPWAGNARMAPWAGNAQAIEAALELGLTSVEAGAQGDHKIRRGYLPRLTYSAHYMKDSGFTTAVGAP